jgi:hypothetical protein
MMTHKQPRWNLEHKFNQNWPNYRPTQTEWDAVDVEIILQDILCPEDETDLSIAKELLTNMGISCNI